jgi:hypothetical protein
MTTHSFSKWKNRLYQQGMLGGMAMLMVECANTTFLHWVLISFVILLGIIPESFER